MWLKPGNRRRSSVFGYDFAGFGGRQSWHRYLFKLLQEVSKPSALGYIPQPEHYADLYKGIFTTKSRFYPQHNLFIQLKKLKNTLRHLKGEDLITHLGLEYYD